MLKYRLLTAAVLIPLVVWGVLCLPLKFFVAVTFSIFAGALLEWSYFIGVRHFVIRLMVLILWCGLSFVCVTRFPQLTLYLSLVWWAYAIYLLFTYPRSLSYWPHSFLLRVVTGLMLMIPAWMALVTLRVLPHGPTYVLLLLVLVWGSDSAAYFVGSAWGYEKLAPEISPKKTWQGFYATMVVTLFIATFTGIELHYSSKQLWVFALICLITALASVLGDLTESMFKRQLQVKDTGHILPGHGGLVDRLDSLFAAAPVFAVLMVWFMQWQ